MDKNIEELTILLLYLTAWEEDGYKYDQNNHLQKTKIKNNWKGYHFDILNLLEEKDYIYQRKRGKTLTLSEKGIQKAQKLVEKYLKGEKHG